MTKPTIRIVTRGSPLALAQSHLVRAALAAAHGWTGDLDLICPIITVKTTGDRIQDRSLVEAGGKGLFVKEIEEALIANEADVAVHSMKDMPALQPPGLAIAAVLPREDPHDVFISRDGASFAKLPSARVAQLAYAQVTSFVAFLIESRGGWTSMYQVFDLLNKGVDYREAFLRVYGMQVERLLEAWKNWVAQKKYREVRGLDPETLQILDQDTPQSASQLEQQADRQELAGIRSPTVREHLYLGDLLRYRGRIKAAVVEYKRAKDQAGLISPIISSKLGLSYQLIGEHHRAQSELTQLLRYYPNHGLAHRVLGDVYFALDNYPEAIHSYQRALYINPFNPHLYVNLHQIFKQLGNQDKNKQTQKALEIFREKGF